jgi:hypothetical protein
MPPGLLTVRALIAERLVQLGVEPRQRLKREAAPADEIGAWIRLRLHQKAPFSMSGRGRSQQRPTVLVSGWA